MISEFIAVLVVLSLIFLVYQKLRTDDRILVLASDGRKYLVRNTDNKQDTAEGLARLNAKVLTFIYNLEEQAKNEKEYIPMVTRLRQRYRPDKVSEGIVDQRFTSYTVNKGEEMVLCMRTRDGRDEMYDDNILFYVTLHELAHIGSLTEHHNDEFHKNFRYLLRKAGEMNMFRKVVEQFHYCGINVNGM
jgi:hypothetical protein